MDYSAIKRVPDGHWNSFENHICFRDFLATKFNLRTPDDWYKLSTKTIRESRGNGLLNSKYKGQTLMFLKSVFPDHVWYPWLFKEPLKRFWNNVAIQKQYVEWLVAKMGWTSTNDYYKLTLTIFKDNYGSCLITYHNSSVIQLLTALFDPPVGDTEWFPWKFAGSVPNNYWDSIPNQRKYTDWLFKHLNFTKMEDWYTVNQDTFRENYGSGLVLNSRTHNGSHISLLQTVYQGEYTFLPWLFSQTTKGYWKTLENRILYMKWLAEILRCSTEEDWYKVSRDMVGLNRGGGLMGHYYADDFTKMIIDLNPHLTFERSKFNCHKTEAKLESYLKARGVKFHRQFPICAGKKNGKFRVDYYLYELDKIIELDGPQHFRQISTWLDPVLQTKRDVYKMKLMKEKGAQCIRLLQEDVLTKPESWMDTNLTPLLKKTVELDPQYIVADDSDIHLYDAHKEMYLSSDILFNDLYVETDE